MASFLNLDRKLNALADDLSGRKVLPRLAIESRKRLVPKVAAAVRGDIGDESMSGWWRGSAIDVAGSITLESSGVGIVPRGKGAGPLRVLDQGRNQGNASGFSGPGINSITGVTARTKSGAVRKTRARKGKRWNGTTQGKGTWGDAVEEIVREAPGVFNDIKTDAMARYFHRI
jgi:hypothetical protein